MAKGGKGSDSALGGGIIGIIILIAIVPKQVWIVLGVTIGVSVLVWLIYKAMTAYEAHRIEAAEQARIREAADAARARQGAKMLTDDDMFILAAADIAHTYTFAEKGYLQKQ